MLYHETSQKMTMEVIYQYITVISRNYAAKEDAEVVVICTKIEEEVAN